MLKTAQEDILATKTFLKENQLKEDAEAQQKLLEQQKASQAEEKAITKLRRYQAAQTATDEEGDSIQSETEKMKSFFKKSQVYGKFVQEKEQEKREDDDNKQTNVELNEVKGKYNQLMERFSLLEDVVHQ